MTTAIFNRGDFQHPDDGWYQIEPKGDHPNGASGVVQVIDDEAARSIVNRFNAQADSPRFPGMLIDHEHFKHDQAKETIAYGWLMKLQNRADGIYGQIKWTGTGKAAIDGGDYRFFSTEYAPSDLQAVGSAKPPQVRPLRLDGLTLTNSPNNKGGAPITNRAKTVSQASAASNATPKRELFAGEPVPALEDWFHAVKAMYGGVNHATGFANLVGWSQAWNLCKQQHPELYIAAFGDLSADPYADPAKGTATTPADSQKAAAEMSTITNRIRTETGCSFSDAWTFARREAPMIFNRASQTQKRQPLNLRADDTDEQDRAQAAAYLRRLVAEERPECGGNYEMAFNRIHNREAALNSIASGRLTGKQVFAVHPELFRRIYG